MFWICYGNEKFIGPTKAVQFLLPQSVGQKKPRKDCKLCVLLGPVGHAYEVKFRLSSIGKGSAGLLRTTNGYTEGMSRVLVCMNWCNSLVRGAACLITHY